MLFDCVTIESICWAFIIILFIIILLFFLINFVISSINSMNTINNTTQLQDKIKNIKVTSPLFSSYNKVNDEIPRKIHQIWLGPKEVPKNTKKWLDLCEKYGYEYQLWRENELKEIIDSKYFYETYAMQRFEDCINIVKYEILYNYGGLFVDANTDSVDLPIFMHLPKTGFSISLNKYHNEIETEYLKNNSVLASNELLLSCPKSGILQRVIKSLPTNYENCIKEKINESSLRTGSLLLSSCLYGVYSVIDN